MNEIVNSTSRRRPRRKVWVVLPVFNEEGAIERLLDRIDEALGESVVPYEVIVVDDGSQDETPQILARCEEFIPMTVHRHEVNQGLGGTIRDGLVAAANVASPRDIIVTMDADDTHAPGVILKMNRMVREGFDVVIASRYQPGSRVVGVPFHRRMLSGGASWLFRILFPIRGVKDYTCGYRAYRGEVIQAALKDYGSSFLDQDGFQCMVDILLKLRRRDLVFGEVPFVLRYDAKEGASKMDVMKTVTNTLGLVFRRLGGS